MLNYQIKTVCFLLLLIFSFLGANGQSAAGTWEVYPDPQTNAVYGIHQHKDVIYRAGWFSLFLWDGAEWQIFGGGISGAGGNTSARDLISYHLNGNTDSVLVIGGYFFQAGSLDVGSIAYWDGESYGTFGTGVDGEIAALAVYNGDLIAGGSFDMAGGTDVNNIARWDGLQWHALGNGVYDNVQGSADGVTEMVVWNDKLYVVGDFSHAGNNVQVNYVACWDGLIWSDLEGGMVLNGEDFTGMRGCAVHNDMVVVTGAFDWAGTTEAINVAGWDGTMWHDFPPGPDPIGGFLNLRQAAHTVASYNNLLYVGADFTNTAGLTAEALAVWKNNQWQAVDGGLYGGDLFGPVIYDMSVVPQGNSEKSLLMGGLFEYANGMATDNVARYTTQSIIIDVPDNEEGRSIDCHIYPNPAYTSITIELTTTPSNNTFFTLSNTNGQQPITQPITESQTDIDISYLPNGVYLLKVWNNEKVMVRKFIKQ